MSFLGIPETHNTSHVIFETAVDKVATFTVCCLWAKVHWKGSTASNRRGRCDLCLINLLIIILIFFYFTFANNHRVNNLYNFHLEKNDSKQFHKCMLFHKQIYIVNVTFIINCAAFPTDSLITHSFNRERLRPASPVWLPREADICFNESTAIHSTSSKDLGSYVPWIQRKEVVLFSWVVIRHFYETVIFN